jgi:hypothetical protein
MSLSPPVCSSAWNNSAPTGRILIKFDVRGFFGKSIEKIQVSLYFDKTAVTLHEDLCKFSILSS